MREALVAERTATSNQIHAFLLEFGISLAVGSVAIARLPVLLDDPAHALPPPMVALLLRLHRRYGQLSDAIVQLETVPNTRRTTSPQSITSSCKG